MKMFLTAIDLQAIDAIIARRLAERAPVAPAPIPLPTKLTVREFAHIVQRHPQTIAERRRLDRKFRAHCEGKRPILIHPAALALFGVDSGLAAARLQQWREEKSETHAP